MVFGFSAIRSVLKRPFQEELHFSRLREFSPSGCTLVCVFQRSYYLIPLAPACQQVIGPRWSPGLSCSGHVPFAAETCCSEKPRIAGYNRIAVKKIKGKIRTADVRLSFLLCARAIQIERPLNFNWRHRVSLTSGWNRDLYNNVTYYPTRSYRLYMNELSRKQLSGLIS